MSATVGERIKALRESLHMTQEEFAEYAKIGRPNLARYETGKNEPSISVLMRIADATGTSIDYIVGRSPAPRPQAAPKSMQEILSEDPSLPPIDTLAASYEGEVSEAYKREIARQVKLAIELYRKENGDSSI